MYNSDLGVGIPLFGIMQEWGGRDFNSLCELFHNFNDIIYHQISSLWLHQATALHLRIEDMAPFFIFSKSSSQCASKWLVDKHSNFGN